MQAKFTRADGMIVELSGTPLEMLAIISAIQKPLLISTQEPIREEEGTSIRSAHREDRLIKLKAILTENSNRWLNKKQIWRAINPGKKFLKTSSWSIQGDLKSLIERGEKIETQQGKGRSPNYYRLANGDV